MFECVVKKEREVEDVANEGSATTSRSGAE
jgi:hypothetical protein